MLDSSQRAEIGMTIAEAIKVALAPVLERLEHLEKKPDVDQKAAFNAGMSGGKMPKPNPPKSKK